MSTIGNWFSRMIGGGADPQSPIWKSLETDLRPSTIVWERVEAGVDMAEVARSIFESSAVMDGLPDWLGWEAFDDTEIEWATRIIREAIRRTLQMDDTGAAIVADYEETIRGLNRKLQSEREKVEALSQPRVFHVAGMVETDLAERYESMRAKLETVEAELATLRAPRSADGVSLYRAVDALGGEHSGDMRSIGYNEALEDVATILSMRGYSEAGDPAPTYDDEARDRAGDEIAAAYRKGLSINAQVDAVAEALGMRKVGQ